ncbi:type 1 glutamine amidotransferase domain-containing protein [Streptomyces sp. NPDC051217]|uniref:type 1 glutamine amidotransferase domain-containing protein n=1 Tax=Streptomyces sp. NPDC051217 TaxID=3365644 RepID=UPI00378B959C
MTSVLMVLSGVDHWTGADGTKEPSGFWPEEFAVPHRLMTEAGFDVDVASTAGGKPTPDQEGLSTEAVGPEATEFAKYLDEHSAELTNPTSLADVRTADDYDAVFIVGGHGPMEDLAHDPDVGRVLSDFDAAGKVIAPLCHGPGSLLSANLPGGGWLFEGRKLTGFTNEEERLHGSADRAPWLLEDVLRSRGADIQSIEAWGVNVVVDGNLMSGQNPNSSHALAEKLIDTLNKSDNRA